MGWGSSGCRVERGGGDRNWAWGRGGGVGGRGRGLGDTPGRERGPGRGRRPGQGSVAPPAPRVSHAVSRPPEPPGWTPGSPAQAAGSPGSSASCSACEASRLGVSRTRKLKPAARDTAKVTRWPGFEPSSCWLGGRGWGGAGPAFLGRCGGAGSWGPSGSTCGPRRLRLPSGRARGGAGPLNQNLLQPGITSWLPLAKMRTPFLPSW